MGSAPADSQMDRWVSSKAHLPPANGFVIAEDQTNKGHKRFMACSTMENMLTRLGDIDHGYELIPTMSSPVWLFCDFDLPERAYPDERVRDKLKDAIVRSLEIEGLWTGPPPSTFFMSANKEGKTSIHVKFQVQFGDVHSLKAFMTRTRDRVLAEGTPELVSVTKNGVQCGMDLTVYSEFRSMRAFGKSKFGQQRPLLEFPGQDPGDVAALRRNLVRFYAGDPTELEPESIIAGTGPARQNAPKTSGRGPVRTMVRIAKVPDSDSTDLRIKFSDYINRYDCLTTRIGGKVDVSKVTEMAPGITCCSIRKSHRHTCPYAKRCHEGNNLYMIVNMARKTITVRCHDEECSDRQEVSVVAQEVDDTNAYDRADMATMHGQESCIQWDHVYESEIMKDYPTDPLVAVRAGMGVGKTKALLRLAAKEFTKTTKALIVTHSRSLASKMHAEFEEHGFVHYHSCYGAILDAKVVVCMDSIHRVSTGDFDFVFLDEAVSLFLHLNSPLMGTKTALISSAFELAIINAKHVYFLDACMDHTFGKSIVDYFAEKKGIDAYWIRNTYVRDTNRRMMVDLLSGQESNVLTCGNQLSRAAGKVLSLLEAGKNVVVCSSSKAVTIRLENFVKQARPGTTMLVYNSDTNESLAGVEESWAKVQLLVYSPTVTAGVSFEGEHFDALVAVVNNSRHSPTVDMTMQQLFRVRRLRSGEMHVYVHEFQASHGGDGDCSTDDEELFNANKVTYALSRDEVVNFLQADVSLSDKYFSKHKVNVPCVYRPSDSNKLEYDVDRMSFLVIVGIVMMRNRSTVFYSSILSDTIHFDYGVPIDLVEPANDLTEIQRDLLKGSATAYAPEPADAVTAAFRCLMDNPLRSPSAKLTVLAKSLYVFMFRRWNVSTELELTDGVLKAMYEAMCESDSTDMFHRAQRFVQMSDRTVQENRVAFATKICGLLTDGDPNFELYKARAHMFRMKTVFGQMFLEGSVPPEKLSALRALEPVEVHEDLFKACFDKLVLDLPVDEKRLFGKVFSAKMPCGFTCARRILHEAFGIVVKRRDSKHDRPLFTTLRLTQPHLLKMVTAYGADLRRGASHAFADD